MPKEQKAETKESQKTEQKAQPAKRSGSKKLFLFIILLAVAGLSYCLVTWHVFKKPTFLSEKIDCTSALEEYAEDYYKDYYDDMSDKSADDWEKELRNYGPGEDPWSTPSMGEQQDFMNKALESQGSDSLQSKIFGYTCAQ